MDGAATPADGAREAIASLLPLHAPTDALRGVGPQAAARLAAAGIDSLRGLLLFFPRRHREILELTGPDASSVGRVVRLRGRVERTARSFLPGRRSLVTVTFAAPDGGRFRVPFFNQPWLKNVFEPGVERQLEGRLDRSGGHFVLAEPTILSPRMDARGACVVRYPAIDGVSEARLRALIDQALTVADLTRGLGDELPRGLVAGALPLAAALRAMHQPQTVDEHERARRGFAVREAVALFRDLERARRRRLAHRGPRIVPRVDHESRLRRILPFSWTGDQQRAVDSIRRRLVGTEPMGVLLQGDVGAGKTAVALDAMLAVIDGGFQAAFLAPTELLAEQHFAALAPLVAAWGGRAAYLSGALPLAERRVVEAGVATGDVDVVVGTHALFSDSTVFARLGLVVVDEQHRFGVEQRTQLVAKGSWPHVLVMTATPIPRTAALARFGDLDVETLRERPAGREPAPAVFVARSGWPRIVRAIARHVRRAGRVFVVCPKIGEDGGRGGAVRVCAELGRSFSCELVHGRMPAAERRARTDGFRDGRFDVLVGTTVLEVGVDVPDATLMVVVGADRFGLAQLHQLRGRVGRARRRGLCILTGEPSARTAAVCRSRDGFDLAEQDLRLRGAGELLGARQSGALDLRALDPVDDYDLLRQVRDAVRSESASELETPGPEPEEAR